MQTKLEKLRTLAGYTPLHCHAQDGEAQAVGDLLRAGADKGAVDAFGATPLMHAVEEGHVSVARALLAHDPDLTLRNTSVGATALHLAVKGGHRCTVLKLLMKMMGSIFYNISALDNERWQAPPVLRSRARPR